MQQILLKYSAEPLLTKVLSPSFLPEEARRHLQMVLQPLAARKKPAPQVAVPIETEE